jgi:hypothetical protein
MNRTVEWRDQRTGRPRRPAFGEVTMGNLMFFAASAMILVAHFTYIA